MYDIEQAAGQVVASDTQKSVDAVDQAVMSLAHLCASIVEVSKASNLPIKTAQLALANAGEGLSKMIGTRQDLGHATKELRRIQDASTLQTVGFGCPPEYEAIGQATDTATAREAA
ncbi:hypothetical protein E3U23_06920 [Erythrobacter litoralis]|uniref:hypothetical protein n=1 Tax=Erythrobacter litoralis TaxID=39960 RepID=UPI002434EE5C|nr:hypothetical protein [Erythrobacter litoralis]MDG6078923.1 hypothetical protein [Erythrobacter litoralis]